LIDFLAFLVQKLWPKNNKLINYYLLQALINYLLFLSHNFLTRNLSKSSKVSKDLDFSLVSNKNLVSKTLQSSGLGPGLNEVGLKGL